MTALILDLETYGEPGENEGAVTAMANRREQDVRTFCALCPPLTRIVAAGMLNPETGGCCVALDTMMLGPLPASDCQSVVLQPCEGEAELVCEIFGVVQKFKPLITFNGRGFDFPILIHRAVVHEIKIPGIVKAAAWAKPWEAEPHVDLMHLFRCGGGDRYPLEAYALGYGIDNPKATGGGEHVGDLVRAGDTAGLVDYVLGDVRATAKLWERWNAV